MSTQQGRPWPAIDVAELRYGLAFGSSVEEIADFLQRDVDDVRCQIELRRGLDRRATSGPGRAGRVDRLVASVDPGDTPSRRTDRAGQGGPQARCVT